MFPSVSSLVSLVLCISAPRRCGQRLPSTNTSPVVSSSAQPASEVAAVSPAGIGGSEYAVTYRRGTGLVSGGAGTQGTYTALDPDGLGPVQVQVQSRSPGLSSKAGRRAAMHITGPTLVTVPLHITSNLALGVLQGGGGDRIVHRGREKDGGDKLDWKDGAEKKERRECRGMEWNIEEPKNMEEKEERSKEKDKEETKEEAAGEGAEKEEELRKPKQETAMGDQAVPEQQEAERVNRQEEDGEDAAAGDRDADDDNEYMGKVIQSKTQSRKLRLE